MVTRTQREDWQRRALKVRALCADTTIPLWRKAYKVGQAYQDVQLDGLRSKHRHRFFNDIGRVNQILARYPIETFDDYEQIEPQDLRTIVETFRRFGELNI